MRRGPATSLPLAATRALAASECEQCPMRAKSPLRRATPGDLQLIHKRSLRRSHPRGDVVMHEFGWDLGVLCVRSGLAVVRESDRDGEVLSVALAGPGEMLGVETLFGHPPQHARVAALTDTVVCCVSREAFAEPEPLSKDVCRGVAEAMAERCLRFARELSAAQRRPAVARVLAVVLSLREAFGRATPEYALRIALPLSKAELATVVGVTPATLSRTIAKLARMRVATFRGRFVTIPDLDLALDVVDGLVDMRRSKAAR